jgi:hypothetical protein
MMSVEHLFLLLLFVTVPTFDAKPYGNYGFYSPYPPPPDQVIYDFSPLIDLNDAAADRGHRATRDLGWKDDYEDFLDGSREPTCDELRQMWHYAKRIQQRAIQTNEIQPELHPFISFSPLEEKPRSTAVGRTVEKSVKADADSTTAAASDISKEVEAFVTAGGGRFNSPANRRRMSTPHTPGKHSAAASSVPRKQEREDEEDEEAVYGVVKNHAPESSFTNPLHVRDPAKEIYGLLRERSNAVRRHEDDDEMDENVYGSIRTHEAVAANEAEEKPSYMDLLRDRLGKDADDADADAVAAGDRFGSIHLIAPTGIRNPTSFDKVRALVAANRARQQHQAKSENNPFDLIRERLMNTRLTTSAASLKGSRFVKGSSKNFRRKAARKNKQRKVRDFPLLILHYFFSL